jgi:holo-[acyl-carrier-protein] synthase
LIYGIGTDICDLRRITATFERKGERFAEKVLGPAEILVFRRRLARVRARGLRAHVTVTDESDYAASFVVVETQHP